MVSKWVLFGCVALVASSCIGGDLQPSVWPPPNFRLVVEELQGDGGAVHVVRRFQVDAQGTVVYATSDQPIVDPAGASLPVFDRLSVYQLEPKSVRALARRLDRLGIGELVVEPSDVPGDSASGLTIRWRAFEQQRILPSGGRLRGSMAEIMAVVAAHLPPKEAFGVTMSRPVVANLSGVPAPALGAAAALDAHVELLANTPRDSGLLLAAFALACRVGQRERAENLLERWESAEAALRGSVVFGDDPSSSPRNQARRFEVFLPPG